METQDSGEKVCLLLAVGPHTQRWYDPAKEERHGICIRIHIHRIAH
jgi:hypothetical protein